MISKKPLWFAITPLAVLLALATGPGIARADTPEAGGSATSESDAPESAPDETADQSEQAPEQMEFSALVERALTHYKNGEYEAAIRDLRAAYRKQSKARLLFNLGLAYKKRGDCAGALVYFRSYLNQQDTEKPLVERAQKSLANSGDCEAYSDDLAGRLTLSSTPSGAVVAIDGQKRGNTPTELVGLSSGSHHIRFEHPDRASTEFDIELEAGKDRTIDQKLPAQKQTDKQKSSPPPLVDRLTPVDPIAATLGASGAGLLLTGMMVDFAVLPQTNRKLRVTTRGSDLHARYLRRRKTERVIAHIGYIGGLALIGTGVAWQLVGPSADTETSAGRTEGPSWRIGLSPRGASLHVRFH